MTREYTRFADEKIKELLNQLIEQSTSVDDYRQVMYKIGCATGCLIVQLKGDNTSELLIACTAEDADFLTKGIIDVTSESDAFLDVKLACFWNDRLNSPDRNLSAAPIIKRYHEPLIPGIRCVLVIVKSIVATGCVVRTNLQNLIQNIKPHSIMIVSPVMIEGVDAILKKEFLPEISKKFEFLTYALDNQFNEDGNVNPGIGGDVYTRLGFGFQEDKNKILPELVKMRRHQLKRKMLELER